MSLHDIRYINGKMAYYSKRTMGLLEWVLEEYIQEAKELFEKPRHRRSFRQNNQLPTSFERLRWFHLPSVIQNPAQNYKITFGTHNLFKLCIGVKHIVTIVPILEI